MPTTQTDHDPANGCPKCGGALWDNRATKTNPKAPDYKCKDKACDGCIWPPRNGARPAAAPVAAKQAFTAGPHIPAIDAEHPAQPWERLDKLFNVHDLCLDHAIAVSAKKLDASEIGSSPESVVAIAATLFIAAKDKGIGA